MERSDSSGLWFVTYMLIQRVMCIDCPCMIYLASFRMQAHNTSINLAAHSYFVPESSSMAYLNYGAAVSEVEVNVLTGETTTLSTDIVYDCGQSMNPAVDLGQVCVSKSPHILPSILCLHLSIAFYRLKVLLSKAWDFSCLKNICRMKTD